MRALARQVVCLAVPLVFSFIPIDGMLWISAPELPPPGVSLVRIAIALAAVVIPLYLLLLELKQVIGLLVEQQYCTAQLLLFTSKRRFDLRKKLIPMINQLCDPFYFIITLCDRAIFQNGKQFSSQIMKGSNYHYT